MNTKITISSVELEKQGAHPKAGMTLIEVLVATFISVLVTTSAFAMLSHSSRTFSASATRTQALNDARIAIEYLRSLAYSSPELQTGTDQTLDIDGKLFTYSVTLFNGNQQTKNITVKTDWTSPLSDKTRSIQLSGIIASPLHQTHGNANAGGGKSNNGHGNNLSGYDISNPGKKPWKEIKPVIDDEKR